MTANNKWIKTTRVAFYTLSTLCGFASQAFSEEVKPDMYFDLGNVIVDTRDWSQVDYVTNAKQYVSDLKAKGYQTKLMVNFVDKLGPQTFDTCNEKFTGLVKFLKGKWTGSEEFDWTQFDLVILPPTDEQRKPKPYMFVDALASSCPRPALYQGEDAAEVATADFLGLGHWKVDLNANVSLIKEEDIQAQVKKTFRFSYPQTCEFKMPKSCSLNTAQMKTIIDDINNPVEPVEPATMAECKVLQEDTLSLKKIRDGSIVSELNWKSFDVLLNLEAVDCVRTMKQELAELDGKQYWIFRTNADECDGGNVVGAIYSADLKTPIAHISDGDFVCEDQWLDSDRAVK